MLNLNQQLAQNGNPLPGNSISESQTSSFSSAAMFPSPTADVAMLQPDISSSERQTINLRILQNRQLGMMNLAGRHGFGGSVGSAPGATQLSTSAPISSNSMNECVSIGADAWMKFGGRRMSEQLSGATGLRRSEPDRMDLDSALDELGMLSTVTNSRRQFLLEQQQRSLGLSTSSGSYWSSRAKRLRSKSESSPNLTALVNQSCAEGGSSANGYHIVKINKDFVTGLSNPVGRGPGFCKQSTYSHLDEDSDGTSMLSKSSRSQYRNPDLLEESGRRRRSIPRMSRFRKDRYRRSRCPYAIPNRLSSSMQEADFGPDYFETCPGAFFSANPPPSAAEEALTDQLSTSLNLSSCPSPSGQQQLSKSNTTSPVKPAEVRLTRSLSAESLAVRRRLELAGGSPQLPVRERSSTERGLDLMTRQMTNLHMN